MPCPMPHMSAIGRWSHTSRRKLSSSSSPMPSSACLAVTSSATFARNMSGPIPAVAAMPVRPRTATMSLPANARVESP